VRDGRAGRVQRTASSALAIGGGGGLRVALEFPVYKNVLCERRSQHRAFMVEDIIAGLSRIKWLFVVACNSSFTYDSRRNRLEWRRRHRAEPAPG
jgi:hypothetical protein